MLKQVSLTGVDDSVPIEALASLSEKYPFVEWGVLYYPEQQGKPRNPSNPWIKQFLDATPHVSHAIHLCGVEVFRRILAGTIPLLWKFDRIQININARKKDFTDEEVLTIYWKLLRYYRGDLILQYHKDSADVINSFLPKLRKSQPTRVGILLDESRGKGVVPEQIVIPEHLQDYYIGDAGGIDKDNAEQRIQNMDRYKCDFWFDLESGARTDNKFDLIKAERILLIGERYTRYSTELP